MALPARKLLVSIEDYLRLEQESPVRHEYVDGVLYAMAGAGERHNRIAVNLVIALGTKARNESCRVYVNDMKVQIGRVFYYPDLMVVCDPSDREDLYKTRPCLLIEVLSPSTEITDRREKLHAYRQIETLENYLLVHPDARLVERHYRDAAGEWWLEAVSGEGAISLGCPGLELALADVYRGL